MFDLIRHRKGAINTVPSFIPRFEPIREVRFARKPDGTPDGGVHHLFTIVGRSDILPPSQSIAIFSGEAYNVEMGVTNDLFTQAITRDQQRRLVALPLCHVLLDRFGNFPNFPAV
jgi:hypothetical protein